MCLGCVERAALKAMQEKAKVLGLKGVAGVYTSVPPKEGEQPFAHPIDPQIIVCESLSRPADQSKGGDTGDNYMAYALNKFAEMLDSKTDSGKRDPIKDGEFGYRGGILRPFKNTNTTDLEVYIFFSGGTEDQDVQVAVAGWETYKKTLDATIKKDLADAKLASILLSELVGGILSSRH